MMQDRGAFAALLQELSRLPGLGPRSARRVALHLLTARGGEMARLTSALQLAAETMRVCPVCGNLDDQEPCRICRDGTRDSGLLCVVAGVADVWAIERTHQFKGRYHVLGGVLSAIDGVTPDFLRVQGLLDRLAAAPVREVVLALAATVDGQTTAHYLAERIEAAGLSSSCPQITRLALGLPMGGELDYLDDGTIAAALCARA